MNILRNNEYDNMAQGNEISSKRYPINQINDKLERNSPGGWGEVKESYFQFQKFYLCRFNSYILMKKYLAVNL